MPKDVDLIPAIAALANRHAAEVRGGRDLNDHLKRLVKGVDYYFTQKSDTHQAQSDIQVKPPVYQLGDVFQDRLNDGSNGPKMVVIPAGRFLMGSPENEPSRRKDEGPQHHHTVFYG